MPLSLRQIHLENFRVFKKLEFSFAPLTILTGPNSSGKSSIVKALLLLQDNLEKYQLGQLDFTDDSHRLGSFKSTKNRYTQDNQIGIALQYLVTADQKSSLYTLNNQEITIKLSFVPQNAGKAGILVKQDVRFVSSGVSIFSIRFDTEAERYSLDVALNRMAHSIKQRNINALKPTMHIIRDNIEPVVFETHFNVLRQQFENKRDQEKRVLDEQMNRDLETNPELLDLQQQLATIEKDNRMSDIAKNFEQWEEENRPPADASEEVRIAYHAAHEARKVDRKREEEELAQSVAKLQQDLDKKNKEINDIKQKRENELEIGYNKSIETLTPGNYHTLIYRAIIDKTNLFLDELTTFSYSFSAKKHRNIADFLNDNEWEAQLVDHLSHIDDTTIEDIIADIPELHFLIAAQKLLPITLGDVLKNVDEQLYSQAIQLLIEEIRGFINEFREQLLFEYIDGIRGQQKRFYHLKTEYALDKTIGYLLEMQNKSNKTIKKSRGNLKKDVTRNKVSQINNEDKILFIKEWAVNFGIIKEGGHIEAEQIDGAFVDIKLYRTQDDWEQKAATSIADLGLGISQLLPIMITTAYHLGEGTLVAIEEPESHLHPKLQSTLADFMVAAIGKDVRFLVETHSVYFIRKIEVLLASKKLSSNDLRVCYIKKNENDGTKDRQVIDIDTNEDGLNAESTADLWSDFYDEAERLTQEKQMLQKFKNELGLTTKCLVLTEDQKHVEYPYLMILLKSCGFKEEEVKIVWYGNCDKMDIGIGMAKYAESIPTIQKIIFHRDADGLHQNHEEKIKGMLKHNNIKKGVPFVTYYNSIEGYFVNPEHILALFANLPEQELKEKINCAITALKIEDLKRLKQKYYDEEAAELKYEREPLKYCNTKELIKKINVILQVYAREGIISANPTLLQTSSKLIDEHLIQIAQQIWGNPE